MNRQNIKQHGKKQDGFTLIELIIVIVLLGIMGAMGAGFISEAFKGFFDTNARLEIYEEGKTALMRMEREIHIAVPNAIEVSTATHPGDTISLGVIDENAMAGIFGQYLEKHPTGTNIITDRQTSLSDNSLISIYNTSWDDFAGGSRVYRINGVNSVSEIIGPASPYGRFYYVRDKAIRFEVSPSGTLQRRTAEVNEDGVDLAGFNSSPQYPLAKHVSQITGLPFFTYVPGTSTRNSLLIIHFAISSKNETVNFHKEVQIHNVP